MKRKLYILCALTWLLLILTAVLAFNDSLWSIAAAVATLGVHIWEKDVRTNYNITE
jgi:hypothetical protein